MLLRHAETGGQDGYEGKPRAGTMVVGITTGPVICLQRYCCGLTELLQAVIAVMLKRITASS
jgi:hypothetical protein